MSINGRGQAPLESAGIKLEDGNLALFYGRLCTVLRTPSPGGPIVVEVTDDGGITRRYTTFNACALKPLPHLDKTVLDTIQAVAQPELSWSERRAREAEVWLTNPQVGDEFQLDNFRFLKITALCDDGSVTARMNSYMHDSKEWWPKVMVFKSAAELRQRFQHKSKPGYLLSAHASLRSGRKPKQPFPPREDVARYSSQEQV
jgi:hypothetical protein